MRSTRPSFFGIFFLSSLALLQILFPTAQPSVVHAFTTSLPPTTCHSRSKSLVLAMTASIDASEQEAMEHVVRTYFDGVNKKDPEQIKACFGDEATIRDVCGIHTSKRNVVAQDLADRCMEFLAAHPDTKVDFHYGPECGRNSRWVVAHWYETGTWSGESCGIPPTHQPMEVEGQTRFFVSKDFKIVDMVVTRTFTEWENQMLLKRQQEQQT